MAKPKRPLSKRQLEIQLGKLRILENPQLKLEQYPVSPQVASELLHMAGFEHDDLQGQVIDLGTGTGRLAIGAALMGTERIVGVDVDPKAIKLAQLNAHKASVSVDWAVGDLDTVQGRFDTVIMNPPYGTRTPHKDITFLAKALELAPIAYSIHKSSTREFLLRFAKRRSWKVDGIRSAGMEIPRLFEFHRTKWKTVQVDLYRMTR